MFQTSTAGKPGSVVDAPRIHTYLPMTTSRSNTYDWTAIEDAVSSVPPTDPWWSGQSVFKELTDWDQPSGPFYHVVYGNTSPLSVGDYLTTPASRKNPGGFPLENPTARQIAELLYDPHAVYVTTERPGDWLGDRYTWYEVVPEGVMWSDPQRPGRDAWCCDRARVVAVHRPLCETTPLV